MPKLQRSSRASTGAVNNGRCVRNVVECCGVCASLSPRQENVSAERALLLNVKNTVRSSTKKRKHGSNLPLYSDMPHQPGATIDNKRRDVTTAAQPRAAPRREVETRHATISKSANDDETECSREREDVATIARSQPLPKTANNGDSRDPTLEVIGNGRGEDAEGANEISQEVQRRVSYDDDDFDVHESKAPAETSYQKEILDYEDVRAKSKGRLLTKETLEGMTYHCPENEEALFNHCDCLNRLVVDTCFPSGCNKSCKPFHEVIAEPAVRQMLRLHWELTDQRKRLQSLECGKVGLIFLKRYLKQYLDIDLNELHPEIEARWNTRKTFQHFFRRVIMYVLQLKQNGCSCPDCDVEIGDNKQFGGCLEGDHGLENIKECRGLLKKGFECSASSLSKPFPIWLAEWAKLVPKCGYCHQRSGQFDLRIQDLPEECVGRYVVVDENGQEISSNKASPQSFSQSMSSEFGKKVMALTDKYHNSPQLGNVSFDSLKNDYEAVLSPFKLDDYSYKNAFMWERSNTSERKYTIKSLELQLLKRLCRSCFLCGESTLNKPVRKMSGFHGHHVKEREKSFNPSQGPMKPIKKMRSESSKTVCLCSKCHLHVTYDPNENKEFLDLFRQRGFIVQANGKIVNENGPDSLKIVDALAP